METLRGNVNLLSANPTIMELNKNGKLSPKKLISYTVASVDSVDSVLLNLRMVATFEKKKIPDGRLHNAFLYQKYFRGITGQ